MNHLTVTVDGDEGAPYNAAMLRSIRSAMDDGAKLSEGEHNFMKHELIESELMKTGVEYDEAHAVALESHEFGENYDPYVLRQYSSWFGPAYNGAWGGGWRPIAK